MHVSGSKACNEAKACRQVKQGEEGMKQQQRMKALTDLMRQMKAKGGLTRTTVGQLLAADCAKSVASSSKGGYAAEMVELVAGNEEEG